MLYIIPDLRSSAFACVLLVGNKSMNYPRRMRYSRFRNALKHALISRREVKARTNAFLLLQKIIVQEIEL